MYKGEDWPLDIKGDDEFNLDELDFKVLVYPDRRAEEVTILVKSQMSKVSDNHYSGKIGFGTTKNMPIGNYTIEVLIIEGQTSRRIYSRPGAFPVYDSAAKNIE